VYTNVLGAHVTQYDFGTRATLDSMRSAFVARGSDVVTATGQAHGALFGMVQKQAAMLSFTDAYRLLAVLLLIAMPLVFLMRRPATKKHP
jgi:DHA2 family multidrug resistance protein